MQLLTHNRPKVWILAALACAQTSLGRAKVLPSTPCHELLARQINQQIAGENLAKNKVKKSERLLIARYLAAHNLNDSMIPAHELLKNLLQDQSYLIDPAHRQEFLQNVEGYLERGGQFSVVLNLGQPRLSAALVTSVNGQEFVQVPAFKIIRDQAGVPDVRLSLLSDIVHELEHSRVDTDKRQELANRGINVEGSIYNYLTFAEFIDHTFNSEQAAIAAEKKFVPQAINNAHVRYYAYFQTLQRILNRLPYKNAQDFAEEAEAYPLFIKYSERLLQRYQTAIPSSLTPERMRAVKNSSSPASILEKLISIDLNSRNQMGSIAGRLNPARAKFLRHYLLTRLHDKIQPILQTL